MPAEQKVALPFPVRHVLHRYQHHAGPSGTIGSVTFLGKRSTSELVSTGRERHCSDLFALLDARFGAQWEYSRYDWVLERALMKAMRNERGVLFHVLYGEKNYRHSWKLVGMNGNRLIATLHHPAEHYEWLFRSRRHLRSLSHAIVMSEDVKEFAEEVVGRGRVSVVPHGVDVEYFKPALGLRERRAPQLVFAGFHERDYGVLARVVETVVKGHPSAGFVMVSKDVRCEEIAQRFPTRARRVSQLPDEEYPGGPPGQRLDGAAVEAERRL